MKVCWQGSYCYDVVFDEAEAYGFTIEAEFLDGSFRGEFSEEEFTGLTGEKGTVKGFIEGGQISFVKKFPFQYDELEDGSVYLDFESEGHEVTYDGIFNQETGEWEGEWEILVEEVKINEEEYEQYFTRGSWKMKRVTAPV